MNKSFRRKMMAAGVSMVLAVASWGLWRLVSGQSGSQIQPKEARAKTPAQPEPHLARPEPELEEPERGDHPGEAMEFRRMMWADEHGQIPEGALMTAKRHADAMRTASARNRLIYGNMADASGIDSASWTWLGPGNIGGRIRSIVIDPNNSSNWFVGSVGGGIWHSTDAGATWAPVNDFMANLAVASMAMQPGASNIIYAGTGEGTRPIDGLQGAGIFKSTDGGATWTQLSSTVNQNFYFVNRVAVNTAGTLLAATGNGLFRSLDAGKTFTSVATTTEWHGFLDAAFNPTDSTKALASGYKSVWYSTDSGATWKTASGLPASAGRIEVAYAPLSPSTVYASVDINSGTIFKSTDGGATFTQVSVPAHLSSQGWYANTIWVDPTNSNTLVVGGLDLWRSTNGGTSFTQISDWRQSPNSAHADHHMIVSVPNFDGNAVKTVLFANDGGLYSTSDVYTVGSNSTRTQGWSSMNHNLGITQLYGAGGNPASGVIVAGAQDNGTLRYTPSGGQQGYTTMFGGDGGYSAADPQDANYFYGEYVYLNIHRSTDGGRTSQYIYKGIADAVAGGALFIAPFILDPNNNNTMLAGGKQLWRSTNVKAATPTWASIRAAGTYPISAIAVAQGNEDVCWVGQQDGQVFKSTNCSQSTPTWTRVDSNGLPSGRMVLRVTIDGTNANSVYVSLGGFTTPNLWRTTDGGTTWKSVTGSGASALPPAPVHDLAILPSNSSILFAATEVGIFSSADQGNTWTIPTSGPANVSVDQLFWMGNKLIAVTHGRGIYSVTPNPGGSAACTSTTTGPASGSEPSLKNATPVVTVKKGAGLPQNGTWQRKVKADGTGETWTYNFSIPEQGASSTAAGVAAKAAKVQQPQDTGGGSRPIAGGPPPAVAGQAWNDAGATVSAVAAPEDRRPPSSEPMSVAPRALPGLAGVPLAGAGSAAGFTRERRAGGSSNKVAHSNGETNSVDADRRTAAGPPAAGSVVMPRFVTPFDSPLPRTANLGRGSYQAWSQENGWSPLDARAVTALRAQGGLAKRVMPGDLPGTTADASSMTVQKVNRRVAAAHLGGRAMVNGLSAFDVRFEGLADGATAASAHVYLNLSHPHPDQLTVWLVAGSQEVVLWDGRGGDQPDLVLERVLATELRGTALQTPWTLYVSNSEGLSAPAVLEDFRILVSPESTMRDTPPPPANSNVDLVALYAYLNTKPGANGNNVENPVLGQPVYLTFDWQLAGVNGTLTFSGRALLDGVYYCGFTDKFDAGYWTTWCTTPWNVTSGPHTLEWDLDYNNVIAESDKTNNSAYFQFSPAAGLDVFAQRAYMKTATGSNGSEVATPALGQTVYFFADFLVSGASGDIALNRQALLDGARFCSGSSVVSNGPYYTWCTNGWVATGGSHTLEWVFDYTKQLPIPDRSDNKATAQFTVSGLNLTAEDAYLLDAPYTGNLVTSPSLGQTVYLTFDWGVTGADQAVNVPWRALLDGTSYCSFTDNVGTGEWTSWCGTGWPATAGKHTLEFDLDPEKTLFETDKTDNTVVTAFSAAGLDLAAERVYFRAAASGSASEVPAPAVGQTVFLTLDWTVTGASGTISVPQRALLDGATYCSGNSTVSNGSWYTFCNTGWVATAGQHQLEWDVNYNSALAEINYKNNVVTNTVTTTGVNFAATKAFLATSTNGGGNVASPATGATVYLTLSMSVTGATGNVVVPVRATLDGSVYCTSSPAVTNGAYFIWCSAPWTVTPGSHTLQWDIDPAKTVNEPDRSNNTAAFTFATSDPDLVALRSYLRTDTNGLGVEVDPPQVGQTVYLTLDWQFNGVGGTVAVNQRASLDGNTFCSFVASAAPGTTWNSWCSQGWTVTSGAHTVRWDLDYTNTVQAAKATKSASKTFTSASGGSGLDLVALRSYLKSDLSGGAEVAQPAVGQTVYFYFDWQVTGTGSAVAVANRAVLDGNVFCTGSSTAAPPSNWSSWCNNGWTATAGSHTVRWDLDFNNTIAESNKNNNSASVTFTPTATGTTLDISAVRAYLESAATGGTEVTAPATGQTVYFYVDWQLSGASSNTTVTERATLDGNVYCTGSDTLGNGSYSSHCGQGWNVTSGPHTLQWDLNYDNSVTESNRNNNSTIDKFTPVDATQAVDISALKAYVKTGTLTSGNEVDPPTAGTRVYPALDWQVTGTGNIVVTQRALIDGTQACSCAVPVSAGSKFVTSCSQAWNVSSGSHKLQWDLNYDNSISEGNKSNNTATKSYTVK